MDQTVSTSGAPSQSVPKAGPCAMVIFGGGGDLTKRLVTPALYNLATTRLLPDDFAILGIDHSDGTDESLARQPDRDDAELHRRQRRVRSVQNRHGRMGLAEAADVLPQGRLRGPKDLRGREGQARGPGRHPQDRRQRAVLPRRRGPVLRHGGGQARRGPPRSARHGRRGPHVALAPRRHREAVRPRPGFGAGAQCPHPQGAAARTRSTGSTISSGRRRSRTS